MSTRGLGRPAATRYGAPRAPSPRARALAHYWAALMYERDGAFEKAVEELREAADLAPESLVLTLRLIHGYVRQEDFDNALAMAERAVAQSPEIANLWIVLGQIYHRFERFDEAVESFQKAVELDPQNLLGYNQLASVQEQINDIVAAIDIYRRMAELEPNAPGLHYQLGMALARVNDAEGARAALERALELEPKLVRARFLLGVILLEQGENQAAREHLEKYLAAQPNDARARENLAGACARMRQYPQAIRALRPVVLSGNADPRHSLELTYLLLRAGRYQKASQKDDPDDAPLMGTLLRALAWRGLDKPYRALLESLDGLDGDVDDECTRFLNEILFLFGDDEAGPYFIDTFNALRQEGLESRTMDLMLARTFMALERYRDAEPVLLEALERYGADPDVHYYLAIVYESLDRAPETEHHLKAYLGIRPNDPDVLNFLGYFYAEENVKLDEAEQLLKRALDMDPESGFYLDSLGWIYYRMGDADRAIEYIRKAVLAMDHDDAEVRDHLGDAYLLKGNVERAMAEWKRARRLDPEYEGVQEKIDRYQKEEEAGRVTDESENR